MLSSPEEIPLVTTLLSLLRKKL